MVAHINVSLGFSLQTAAAITALTTVFLTVGTVVGGWLGDRFSKRLIIVFAMFGHMVAMLLVVFFSSFLALVGFAVIHGFSWGSRGPLINALRADYFGRASFGKIMGVSNALIIIGTITGPMVAGYMYDTTGTYQVGFDVLAAMSGAGSIFFVLAKRPRPPVRAAIEDAGRLPGGAGGATPAPTSPA